MKKLNRYELARQFNVHEDVARAVCIYYNEDEKLVKESLSKKENYLRICRLQKYKKNLSLEDFEIIKNLSDKEAREFMREKTLEKKHGTLENFYKKQDEKRKNTLMEKYGRTNSFDREKSNHTKIERYGDVNYNNREKAEKTCIERYNVKSFVESKEFEKIKEEAWSNKTEKELENIKEKRKATLLERYRDINYNNREKAKQTSLERYGEVHYTNQEKIAKTKAAFSEEKKKEIKEKTKQTILDKYQNLENYNNIRLEKSKQTKLEKYGDEYYNNLEQANTTRENFSEEKKKEIENKKKITLMKKYGKNYIEVLKNKRIETCIEKYGVENPMMVEEIKEKSKNNQNLKYGKHREKIVEKSRQTCLERYGVENIFKTQDFPRKYPGHISEPEQEIRDFLKSLNVEFDTNCRNIISTKEHLLELDIYIPSKKVALEYDGLYWHSEYFKPNNYHALKSDLCRKKGIRLIHIFGDYWENKKEICKSIIKSSLNIYDRKIYARKCKVMDIDDLTYKNFLEENHIQGPVNSFIRKGLFYNRDLVQVIGVGKSRFKKDEYELHRMCTKLNTQVLGGFSKLLKSLNLKSLITYVDLSLFNGKGYESIGFKFVKKNPPNYWYLLKGCGKRFSRQSCQKHKLKKLLGESFDSSLTEVENMHKASYVRIFDSGNLKLVWEKS